MVGRVSPCEPPPRWQALHLYLAGQLRLEMRRRDQALPSCRGKVPGLMSEHDSCANKRDVV